MSSKAARGIKRLCDGCGAKFYDLNNTPIICPMCEAEFKIARPADDKDAKIRAKEAEAKEAAAKKEKVEDAEIDPDVAAIDDEDLADIDDTDDDADDSTDAFLPEEDEGDEDVADIVGDNKPKVEDEG